MYMYRGNRIDLKDRNRQRCSALPVPRFTEESERTRSCNPGGGSPSLHLGCSRITGPLFTVRVTAYCRYLGVVSEKQMSDSRPDPLELRRPSPKRSSK